MTRLTKRDAFVTVIVAAVVVPNVGYVVREHALHPGPARDGGSRARGAAACLVGGWWPLGVLGQAVGGCGATIELVAVGLSIAALAATSEALLATFIGAVVVRWALFMLVHAGAFTDGRTGPTARHA